MIKTIARWTFSLFKQLVIPLAQIGLAEMKSSAIQPLKQGITLAQKSQEIVDPADQVNRAYFHIEALRSDIREEIEPRLADICGTPLEVEWEVYYKKHAVPGIRQSFFLWVTWIVCTLVPFYLIVSEWISSTPVFRVALIILSATYLIAAIATTRVATRK